ncbi:MAG TPA: LysM peptidoglycan-binding domain-containing protein [Candidatus Acidoferrales bacterium]|nr:LysM peptidoglycan-binding domain-containing protein [Candidatus Acidoferrales bacterium]
MANAIKTPKAVAAVLVTGTLGVIFFVGCNQSVQKTIVRQPAPTPMPAPALALADLPLPAANSQLLRLLPGDTRPLSEILTEQVQADYDAGQKQAAAGHEDEAQADYNAALDLMLKANYPVNADPKLSHLFDEIGDVVQADDKTVSDDDADAEASADTTDEADADVPSQPAPIDSIEDMTLPPGDPRLAAMARKELIAVKHDLPLTVNPAVLQYLSFFTTPKGRSVVEHGLQREGQYDAMVRRVLHEEGVPEDLVFLAQAESAFLPDAVSRVGARGIWQFMPYRGEEYGLERNYWIDERSDPEQATRAAARHMRDLYDMFGDWYLVMAAYNSGPLTVSRAIERTGYADFWELQKRGVLPKQTQNYVPIIIAMALVGKDPVAYGIHVDLEKPQQVDTVKPGAPIDLHLVADASGADLDSLHELNPELLRNITPSDPSFALKLPAGTGARFEENIQKVPEEKWTSWRLHQFEDGETLSGVARTYRVALTALEAANHLDADATLPSGFLLNIPAAPAPPRLVHYRVQRGDTLAGIADRYDVTVEELRRWNHLRGTHVARGARLRIYAGGAQAQAATVVRTSKAAARVHTAPTAEAVKTAEEVQYRVKAGETLYSIARTYGTTVSALKQSNSFLAARALQAGDVLVIQ